MKQFNYLEVIPDYVLDELKKLLSDGESVTMEMALVDAIPVIVFMLGMGCVIKMAHGRIKPGFFALLCGGVFTSFFGGACKCVWKILCACGINFTPLTVSFNIYQSVGFCLIAIALVAFARADKLEFKRKKNTDVVLPCVGVVGILLAQQFVSLRAGFMWFIIMAIFTVVYLTCLAILCFKRKMVWQGLLFFVSMLLMFIMAGLGNKFEDPTSPFAKFNWVAQIVNILVQVCMALPAYLLSKKFSEIKVEYKIQE